MNTESTSKYTKWIWILSIAIPVVVVILFTVRIPGVERMGFLPPIYASINALTAFLLVIAFISILNGMRELHEKLMKTSIILSVLFLALYVVYHMTSDSTKFGGEGIMKYMYYSILFTHIILSVTVIPFVLVTYVRAIRGDFPAHKKIARITFPLWLYVAVTGVVVYIMIAPYY
jgi:putative membrane protein